MKSEVYEQACREGCRISLPLIGREMILQNRDDPYPGDFKQTIGKHSVPMIVIGEDFSPMMFPWEVSTASQQEIDHLVA